MATKKKSRKEKPKTTSGTVPTLTALPVAWKSVTFGENIVSIGFSCSRGERSSNGQQRAFTEGDFQLADVDELLTGKRLVCRLCAGSVEISGTVESHGFRVGIKRLAGSLSLAIADIDRGELASLAKCDGRIEIESVMNAGGGDDDGANGGADDDSEEEGGEE